MTRIAGLILAVLSLVSIPHTEDFTGKWSGSFVTTNPDGTQGNDQIVLNLTQKALELTGTAGPSEDRQWPLKGSVEGNKLTFDVTREEAPIKFVLTFAEGHLKGEAQAEFQGQKLSAKIDAQRIKTGF
jgi:hypothetical protein